MFAVIRTGGKQYIVTPGQELEIEKLPEEAGKSITITEVLLVENGEVSIGSPLVKGAKVQATIMTHGRTKKVKGVKFHNKVRYTRKLGHRQNFTKIKIDKIVV